MSRIYPAIPLTKVQESILAHLLHYIITPIHPPNGEYIMTVQQMCLTFEPKEVEECIAKIRGVLKCSCNPKSNLTKEEVKALKHLRQDKAWVMLTVDKGWPW